MSRWIDADALITDVEERYCKPCKDKGEDYHEVRCRACWVDDAINIVDGFADISIYMVRCKDCENWQTDWVSEEGVEDLHYCALVDGCRFGDFFCADGEVRDE